MVPRLLSPSAARRGVALVAVPFLLTTLATPAQAALTAPADRTNTTAPSNAAPRASVFQRKVTTAYEAYETARERVAAASANSARLAEAATVAADEASRLRDEVSHETGGSLLQVLAGLVGDGESDLDRAAAAAEDAEHARQLAALAADAVVTAIADTETARMEWELAQEELREVEAQWTARQASDAAIRRSQFTKAYDVDGKAQDKRNRKALSAWHAYLEDLVEVAVVPPAAKKLANPDKLPNRLERVRDSYGLAVPGVAKVDATGRAAVTVLPSETVRAVSEAFRRVGLADVPGAIAPSTYACGGFLANAWGPTSLTLPADSVGQWRELRTVPRRALQVGDAVVLGSKRSGLEQSGVYVGDGQMIVADPETGTANVAALPRKGVFGVKRVPLHTTKKYDAPQAGECGVVETTLTSPTETGSSPLALPVASGAYNLSAHYGATGAHWSSGVHTGLDFAAPVGTPVVASAAGVVSVETPAWAGNLVRIDHGGGVETSYAHLSAVHVEPGRTVRRGEVIGAVGNEGNSTGPHLHFEVRLDGYPVDPALVLDVPEQRRPTYPNGDVPDTALCAADVGGLQQLRCDAAVAYRLMSAAYTTQTGSTLCLTDTYRSHHGQEQLYKTKPGLAAVPGTSNHGWGVAIDMCGGVERFDTAEHAWMVEHGPTYGWTHPSWAAAGGTRPEPWHFEYSI